jgi:hypothetical protein
MDCPIAEKLAQFVDAQYLPETLLALGAARLTVYPVVCLAVCLAVQRPPCYAVKKGTA